MCLLSLILALECFFHRCALINLTFIPFVKRIVVTLPDALFSGMYEAGKRWVDQNLESSMHIPESYSSPRSNEKKTRSEERLN